MVVKSYFVNSSCGKARALGYYYHVTYQAQRSQREKNSKNYLKKISHPFL